MAKCEPASVLLESDEWIPVVNIYNYIKNELIYMIPLFCYLLHDVVDAILLTVEV